MKSGVTKLETSLYRMVRHLFRYSEPRIGVDHECDRRTDRQTERPIAIAL